MIPCKHITMRYFCSFFLSFSHCLFLTLFPLFRVPQCFACNLTFSWDCTQVWSKFSTWYHRGRSQMSYAIWFATCKCPQPGKNATQSPRAWAWAWGNLWQTLETAKTIMMIMTTSLMTMTMMMMRKTRLKCFLHNFFSIQQKWTSAGLQSICTSTVTQWQCHPLPLFPLLVQLLPLRHSLSISLCHAKHFLCQFLF